LSALALAAKPSRTFTDFITVEGKKRVITLGFGFV
jgi:hypothetical protein